ncbi:MAG TPA: DUF993 family protein [Pseudonocardiaceae bacterium]|nr:DUF993 family protein [Pseudonocardiaceae bacterium]
MAAEITLPGRSRPLVVDDPAWPDSAPPPRSRRVYAAAHVAALPDGTIDWPATLAFREHLWGLGFGVADAMDTAQRGMGLTWPDVQRLIAESGSRAAGRALACGAGTDQLTGASTLADITAAYREQVAMVQDAGATVILMASRALAASGASAHDYRDVYGALIESTDRPVILHWLGDAFDPALAGYWGSADLDAAADTVLSIIGDQPAKVDGVKVSLLDADREIALRRRLPAGVRLYTGDDFHYDTLIEGDDHGHSDALLGAFAAIAAPASAALHALDAGDVEGYRTAIGPTVPLSRHVFAAPTYHYKTGIAFLAWLGGFQEHFAMLDGQQTARSTEHLTELFTLAAAAGVLRDPELAVARMTELLAGRGAA